MLTAGSWSMFTFSSRTLFVHQLRVINLTSGVVPNGDQVGKCRSSWKEACLPG
jgi:hypothetical protein